MTRRLSNKSKGLDAYAVEIPTREAMIEAIAQEGPVDEVRLREVLGIADEQLEGFERRLAAMERDGQVVRNRRGLLIVADKAGLVKGKVIGHPDGFGFLKPEDGTDDLFLSPKE